MHKQTHTYTHMHTKCTHTQNTHIQCTHTIHTHKMHTQKIHAQQSNPQTLKKDEMMSFAVTWMNLEDYHTKQSKSDRKRQIPYNTRCGI